MMEKSELDALRRKLESDPKGARWRGHVDQFPDPPLVRFADGTFMIHANAFGAGHLTPLPQNIGKGIVVRSLREDLPTWVPREEPVLGHIFVTEITLDAQCSVHHPPEWLAEACAHLAAGEPDAFVTVSIHWFDYYGDGQLVAPRLFFDP